MISKMKTTAFESVDDKKWEEVAIKSLRGLPFEKLMTKTVEGIDIAPLYTKESIEKKLKNKHQSMLQTIRNGTSPSWTIAQPLYTQDSKQFIEELMESLEKGNEAIVYNGRFPIEWNAEQLSQLATLVQTYPFYAFHVAENDSILNVFSQINESKRKNVKGAISGQITLPKGYDHVRTIVADTISIHHQGADIVTELAIALAIAAEEATHFDSFSVFSQQFFVRFAVDTHFFMEIAKIRAFRMLWQTLAHSYGDDKSSTIPIISETSLRTYSKLDPYVNLLRAGNEAFSAVLGGTDVLTVHPHDIVSQVTSSAKRIARNVQLVIKEETFVNDVLDPAGGSYYIDTLTNELIEKAWALFQEIEAQGGYAAYISSGALERRIEKVYDKRISHLSHQQHSLIGTNKYVDLSTPLANEKATIEIEGRLAEAYENLRQYFAKNQPKIALLNFGQLKDFKARADFVTGFLAAGGLKAEWSPAFETVEEGRAWIEQSDFDYGVICASAKEIESVISELALNFPNDKWMDIAGSYDKELAERWKEIGIKGFIFNGQDQLAKLLAIKALFQEERS